MPKENEGKGQEPESGPANTEKGQENRPRRKRIRQQRSQTDDKLMNEGHDRNGCTICNGKLDAIQEKLDQVLLLNPEVEHLRAETVGGRQRIVTAKPRVHPNRSEGIKIAN